MNDSRQHPTPTQYSNPAHQQQQHRKPSSLKQFATLLRRDIRQEMNTRDMLSSMGVYALLVLIIFGATLTQNSAQFDLLKISGGLIWALIVFTSLLGLNRSFSGETADAALDGILLIPMDRSVIYLAKAASNLLFLFAVEVVVVPLFYFFFLVGSPLPGETPLIVLPLLAGSIGIAAVGTLLATITVNASGRDVLLAILFIPLVFPLLYAVVSSTAAVIVGSESFMLAFLPGMALAAVYDVIMVSVSWLLYDYVISN